MSQAAVDRLARDIGALIEDHARARDLADFARYSNDPVAFIREVLSGDPWSMQEEIATAVRDETLVVVRSCNGMGKDWLAARLALWWIYGRHGFVLCTAPTERQLKAVVMDELRSAFAQARDLPGQLFEMALRVDRAERIGLLAFTSSEASRLTGFHAPKLMVLMTEAQGVEDFAWEGMHANLTGSDSRFLALGNPLEPSGGFYRASQSPDWTALRIAAGDHPNVQQAREVIPGGVTKDFIERIRREYGEKSGVYRSRVLGEFPIDSDEGLISQSWLEAAAERAFDTAPGNQTVVAIDPARLGPDASVMAVRKGPVLKELKIWRRMDTAELTGRIIMELRRLGVTPWDGDRGPGWGTTYSVARGRVIIDEVGLGAGVLDRLRELRYNARGFNGGRRARKPARFANLRAETYWHLRKLVEDGRIRVPRDDQLWQELTLTAWRPDSSGRVTIEPKDDLRTRLGRSPDRADAVSMVFESFESAYAPKRMPPLYY